MHGSVLNTAKTKKDYKGASNKDDERRLSSKKDNERHPNTA